MAEGADLPFGLASAVGPVPFASADDAVAFALRRPRYPTVPVTSDPSASLWAQAVSGLDDGIGADAAGTDLSGPAFAAARAFVDALAHLDVASVPVAIRVPVLGPVTVASELRRLGRPAVAELDPREQFEARVLAAFRHAYSMSNFRRARQRSAPGFVSAP